MSLAELLIHKEFAEDRPRALNASMSGPFVEQELHTDARILDWAMSLSLDADAQEPSRGMLQGEHPQGLASRRYASEDLGCVDDGGVVHIPAQPEPFHIMLHRLSDQDRSRAADLPDHLTHRLELVTIVNLFGGHTGYTRQWRHQAWHLNGHVQ